ncbi:MAG: transposase [Bacteroidaceae bacterium]|nr:transposase [Bacteroidaceae bacterium]
MSRKSRRKASTGIYHIMLRGINKQDIFEEERDYLQLIQTLRDVKLTRQKDGTVTQDGCVFYAWVLMSNHVHLLVKEGTKSIGEIVKSIASGYVFYYNHRYGRVGHLFQDRFRSEPCEDEEYFFTLFRYINQNPLKAGVVNKVSDYPWCSWTYDFESKRKNPKFDSICNVDAITDRISFDGLEDLVENVCVDKEEDFRKVERDNSDEKIKLLLSKETGFRSPSDYQNATSGQLRKAFEIAIRAKGSLEQLSRITGLSKYRIRKEMR